MLNGRDKVHPVVKGLPLKWRHAKDELYDRMRGPGNIRDILYTAYSDKETNGSGREEPLVFTVDYGMLASSIRCLAMPVLLRKII